MICTNNNIGITPAAIAPGTLPSATNGQHVSPQIQQTETQANSPFRERVRSSRSSVHSFVGDVAYTTVNIQCNYGLSLTQADYTHLKAWADKTGVSTSIAAGKPPSWSLPMLPLPVLLVITSVSTTQCNSNNSCRPRVHPFGDLGAERTLAVILRGRAFSLHDHRQ